MSPRTLKNRDGDPASYDLLIQSLKSVLVESGSDSGARRGQTDVNTSILSAVKAVQDDDGIVGPYQVDYDRALRDPQTFIGKRIVDLSLFNGGERDVTGGNNVIVAGVAAALSMCLTLVSSRA